MMHILSAVRTNGNIIYSEFSGYDAEPSADRAYREKTIDSKHRYVLLLHDGEIRAEFILKNVLLHET